MQAMFKQLNGEQLPLKEGLPDNFHGEKLQGAVSLFHHTAAGLIVLQSFRRADFAIQLGIFKFLHVVSGFLHTPAFPTASLFARKGEHRSSVPGTPSIHLKEGQFNFLHFGKEEMFAEFKAGKEYQLLNISCSFDMVSQTLPFFTNLPGQFEKPVDDQFSTVITPPRAAGEKVLSLVYDLLHSPFETGVNDIYFEYKVREYLLLTMVELSKEEEPKIYLTKNEKDRILELGERLRMDPQGKYPIGLIAREMGMNEMKLKVAFKQIFGKAIFEFHTDQRMKEAHRLLRESGLPAKKIANMVGYDLLTSFITRFRAYYGYPPSKIQKKS